MGTQSGTAGRLGVDEGTLSRWERSEREPQSAFLESETVPSGWGRVGSGVLDSERAPLAVQYRRFGG